MGKKKEAERPTYTGDWRQRLRLASEATTKHEAARICRSLLNDMVIDNDKQLHERTGVTPDNFDFVCEAFENELIGDGGAPLYRNKPGRGEDPGRRSDLQPRHRILLYLESKRHRASQKNTAINYGIDQSNVSRINQHTEGVLAGFLPTGDNIQERLSKARTVKQVQAAAGEAMAHMARIAGRDEDEARKKAGRTLPHNRILRDGTHVPIGRPHDKKTRDEHWSTKKKEYTQNTVLATNCRGVFIGRSMSEPGSHHDKGILNRDTTDYGLLSRVMAGKSGAMVIWEYVDKGFRGIVKNHPGSRVRMPAYKPRGGELSKTKKAENKAINRVRIKIEHSNGRLKVFGAMKGRHHGKSERLGKTLNVITGLVNLHLLTDSPDPANSHRKGKRPGPKTSRNICK